MTVIGHVKAKQISWAKTAGISLIGSQGDRGEKVYTASLNKNLYVSLSKSTIEQFKQGDGKELNGTPCNMQALHSSSALGVNVFEYWKNLGDATSVAVACGLVRKDSVAPKKIVFEEKYPISEERDHPPNIDVVIHNDDSSNVKRLAIECKFTEPYYGRGHSGLKDFYLTHCSDFWKDIPNLKILAKTISPEDRRFQHLHAAQLLKHILGLKRQFGKHEFKLLYLWYDALGTAGATHRNEVDEFAGIAKEDGIMFRSMTYQKLIVKLGKMPDAEHAEYVQYLANRYL